MAPGGRYSTLCLFDCIRAGALLEMCQRFGDCCHCRDCSIAISIGHRCNLVEVLEGLNKILMRRR
jgi:hypothetical protein